MMNEYYNDLITSYDNNLEELKEQLNNYAKEHFKEELERMSASHEEQQRVVLNSPAYNHNRNQAYESVVNTQEQQRAELESQMKEFKAPLYEERSKQLEELVFEDYGGSKESMLQKIEQEEKETTTQARNEFNEVAREGIER